MSRNMTTKDLIALGLGEHVGQHGPTARRAKYGAVPTMAGGIRFHSKKEARYFDELEIRRVAGDVLWFCRQPRFPLEGGVEYVGDFIVCEKDGRTRVVDVKGKRTREFIRAKKQVEARYRVKIEEV